MKYKEPESTKLVTLEQELVRAEAQSLVAEAQLTNVTRQKFKEAYDLRTAAIIERAEKQILLANHARELIALLDDTPIVPGEERVPFANAEAAREVLNDAEQSLKSWTPTVNPIPSSATKLGANAMPAGVEQHQADQVAMETAQERIEGTVQPAPAVPTHATEPQTLSSPPYPVTGQETTAHMATA